MYYRINRVSFDADKFDEIMAAIEGKRELLESFKGLQSSRIVRVSDTEAITIAAVSYTHLTLPTIYSV